MKVPLNGHLNERLTAMPVEHSHMRLWIHCGLHDSHQKSGLDEGGSLIFKLKLIFPCYLVPLLTSVVIGSIRLSLLFTNVFL